MTVWEAAYVMIGAWTVALFGAEGDAGAVASAIGISLGAIGFVIWEMRKRKRPGL